MEPPPAATFCHVVAMPFPGRGQINATMNLCKLLSLRKKDMLITFVVTEEWFSFIGSDPRPDNLSFARIPNVIPSEHVKADNIAEFSEAVTTKMEGPFEEVLDRLEHPVSMIFGDVELLWLSGVGNRKKIPVASLWTMSASFFSMLHHYAMFWTNNHGLSVDFLCQSDNNVNSIPGISSTQALDLQTVFSEIKQGVLQRALECILGVEKAQYLLLASVDELEPQFIDMLKAKFKIPIYSVGPAIPYFELEDNSSLTMSDKEFNYMQWLDSQPSASVLYISLGSFLSVSNSQMEEIVAGLQSTGVRFLWVARGEASRLKECCGEMGVVVPWCNQLKVLSHASVGGFWTHCGWNSTLESVFSGVPMLTFPIFLDQVPNSRQIVEDWKIGWRVKRDGGSEKLVTREQIACLVQRFMDPSNFQGIEMRKRVKEIQALCHKAVAGCGSSQSNLADFISNISQCHANLSYIK